MFFKILEGLEDKSDAFLDKGLELSKNLSENDREDLIMKLLNELVEIAIKNVKKLRWIYQKKV